MKPCLGGWSPPHQSPAIARPLKTLRKYFVSSQGSLRLRPSMAGVSATGSPRSPDRITSARGLPNGGREGAAGPTYQEGLDIHARGQLTPGTTAPRSSLDAPFGVLLDGRRWTNPRPRFTRLRRRIRAVLLRHPLLTDAQRLTNRRPGNAGATSTTNLGAKRSLVAIHLLLEPDNRTEPQNVLTNLPHRHGDNAVTRDHNSPCRPFDSTPRRHHKPPSP